MSTKTLRKRIALVAVAALGAGVLSVAPANASVLTPDALVFKGSQSVLVICADLSTTTSQYAVIPATSAGIVVQTTATGTDVALGDTAYMVVSGPGSITAAGSTWSIVSPTEATSLDLEAESGVTDSVITIKPSGVGTIKLSLSSLSTSSVVDIITIEVVAACGGGVYSTVAGDNSYVIVDTTADSTADVVALVAGAIPAGDVLYADTVLNEGTGLVRFSNWDEYGTYPTSKALISTVSGDNCYIGMGETSGSEATYPTANSVTAVAASSDIEDWIISVVQKTVGTPATCTVSTTWNGIAIGTKTLKFQGYAAAITVSDVTVGYRGGSGYLRATVTDAAGNALASKTVTAYSSETNNAASAAVVSVGSMTAATAAVTGKTPAIGASPLTYTCTNKGGAAKLTVRVLKDNVSYITSAPFDVYCGEQTADTFTIAMDKASYAPGEIATLTVSAKGAYGTAVHTLATVGADVAAGFGGMEFVTAPTTADLFKSGIGTRTYTLKVGTTEGAFVGTFKMTATTDTAAKTVQYKIASTSTAISLADVLKAIVSLIASINKQIAALQKALLKK
jgi:hypothetical protein